ncbi:MAG: AhpC/TSA family protein [Schlesneria sp.]|nr:AhpC/TSA family protein [Schlesneria sp.]
MSRLYSTLLLIAAAVALLAAVLIQPRVGHPVTLWMSQSANTVTGRPAIPFAGLTADKPTIAIFILPGCPCSEAYEPHTHDLFRAYGLHANIIGVVEGSGEDLEEWQQRYQTPFPLIADPDHSIARSYEAKRSAYTVLITNRTVNRLWPGYSGDMLREVGTLLATAAKIPEVPINVSDAPKSLISGCVLD